jgi:pyruvate dehydrogenase E1 component alpha subunit
MLSDKIINELIRIRLSQVLINEEYKAGRFKIPVHLSFGHEAIAVAVSNTLNEEDKLLLSHRNMAYNLARAGKLRPVMDEYLLNDGGLAKARLGSMNLMNREANIIYSSSILANNFSVAAGVAMADKLKNNQAVTFVLGGDGSMEEGSFYESLVMMKSLGLPVVVIIENNEWSLGTHITERRTPIDLQKLTESVGVTYLQLDNNNTNSYIKTLQQARNKCLNTNEPVCIEVILKTLGDRRNPPSPEYPEGKYINYHAGPSPTVDVSADFHGALLRDNADDPIYVVLQEIGTEKLKTITADIFAQLKTELL